MIIEIPGYRTLEIKNLVLDYNGTIAVDGILVPGLEAPIEALSRLVDIHVLTADTYGTVRAQCAHLPLTVHTFPRPDAGSCKEEIVRELGSGVCSVAEVVDWYGKDPYNKKAYCIGLVYALKDGQKWFSESMKTFRYPVFITHGEKDGLVGMDDSIVFFRNAASSDKTLKVYGNLFHEILNEYCKDDVIADMIGWMDQRI